jgi:hypothetical protein
LPFREAEGVIEEGEPQDEREQRPVETAEGGAQFLNIGDEGEGGDDEDAEDEREGDFAANLPEHPGILLSTGRTACIPGDHAPRGMRR